MTTKELRARTGVTSLLSSHNSNPKVAKAEEKLGIRTAVLHLAPADMSGFEVCPSRSKGCTNACLHHAGAPIYQTNKDRARIARTQFFFKYRELFLAQLAQELTRHERLAVKHNLKPAVRLNGTSDLAWERIKDAEGKTIIERFPNIQFYDYTAVINRLRKPLPANYHLTFSVKEDNLAAVLEAKALGFNLAAVFFNTLPEVYLGLPVIDGDEHDYRPADPEKVVVGLKAKGARGKADESGFVRPAEDPFAVAA